MAPLLITIGAILLLALLAAALADRTPLPRVTVLLLLGVLLGPAGLNWIPPALANRFGLVAQVTLLMVGFLIGGKLSRHSLQRQAAAVLVISLSGALLPVVLVALGLQLLGLAWPLALLLGCMAAATAPAAVLDVVQQCGGEPGSARRRFADLLLGITALDDVWALLLFGLALAVATALQNGAEPLLPLAWALREVLGGVVLGGLVGLPAALFTGRIRDGQPMLLEALGIVLLCGGLALQLQVSPLIAAIVLGATIANLARHHDYPFHAIEGIELPFMALFFVLAGASLDLRSLSAVGVLGLAYGLLRSAGKLLGADLGARLLGAEVAIRRHLGLALLPQAGVAIGMALVAADALPRGRDTLLTLAIGSTVVFELIGPPLVRLALVRIEPFAPSASISSVRVAAGSEPR